METGADGSFSIASIAVPAEGNYLVRAERADYAAQETEEAVSIVGQSAYGVELRLTRGGAIAGRVTGLAFDELARVRILAFRPRRSDRPENSEVDFEGHYRLENLAAGAWVVKVVGGGEGEPIPGADVALTAGAETGSGASTAVRTGPRGGFQLADVAPGSYHLQVSKDGYANDTRGIEVDPRGDLQDIAVRLEPSAGLTLEVTLATGAPAGAVSLLALGPTGLPVLTGRYDADERGHIRLAELPAGSWTLLAAARGTATVRQGIEAPGTATTGTATTVRLPETGSLTVRVPALEGSGRRSHLTLRDHLGQPYRDAHSSRQRWDLIDGEATLPLLPAGTVTIEVRTAGQQDTWTATTQIVPGQVAGIVVE